MVLELSTLCLQSICDGVETGRIRGHHLGAILPPTVPVPTSFRQSLVDLSCIRGSMNNPNCIATFGSKEFIDGMTSLRTTINANAGLWRVRQLYELLATSLAAVSQLDAEKTIGSRIERLQLQMRESKAELVSKLVANCPNLKSLELIVGPYDMRERSRLLFAEELEDDHASPLSESRIVWKLDTFIIDCRYSTFNFFECFISGVYFSNLRTLRLVGCKIDGRLWERFLRRVSSTLISLDVEKLIMSRNQLIPFPMDRLQHLRIGSYFTDGNFLLSTDILAQCANLAHLDVCCVADVDFTRALMQLPIADLRVNVYMLDKKPLQIIYINHRLAQFGIDGLCKDNISGFSFQTHRRDNTNNDAITNFLAACPNLIRMQFTDCYSDPPLDLAPLFVNPERCARFKEISLSSKIKFGKLFEHCIDLDRLTLNYCGIRDQDLIAWTELGGGRLTRLTVTWCPYVTHVGVIALLIASGSKLEHLDYIFKGRTADVECVKRAVARYCPYAIARCVS